MSRKFKITILLWFAFSWLALVALSLKPTGTLNTLKIIVKPWIRNFYVPQELILCDFENPLELSKWRWEGAFMESSPEHAFSGKNSAKVVYSANANTASLILEDHNVGPAGEKDWSYFKFLKFTIFNPQNSEAQLHIKIKDKSGRSFDRVLDFKPGENKFILNLEDAGQFIDLANIIYLNFYFFQLPNEATFYFDNICLARDDLKKKRVLGEPVVNLVRLSCPKAAKKGDSILLSLFFSLSKELRNDYQVFIHITHPREIKKRSSQRRFYINADQSPWVPTSKWVANTPYEIGPLSIYIPRDFISGEYLIQAGFFNPASSGAYSRESSFNGMMDFRGSFPRLRYVNPGIKDFVVGKIMISD